MTHINREDLCEICGLKKASYRCRICRRFVCEDHYDINENICSVCKETLCRVCRKNLSITTCPSCGRLVCHSCLIDTGVGTKICFLCKINGRDKDFINKIFYYKKSFMRTSIVSK